jgi:predicted amino acid dehydrogenase
MSKGLVLIGNPLNRHAMSSLEALAGEIYRHILSNLEFANTPISQQVKNVLASNASVETLLAESVDETTLYQRITQYFLDKKIPSPICLDVRLDPWLGDIDGLLTATSAGRGFVDVKKCKQGIIVCDAAQPPDLVSKTNDSNSIIFNGGELWLPNREYRFGSQNITGLDTGKTLACLGETIVLTMSDQRKHHSVGTSPCYQEAKRIYELSQSFGFQVVVPAVGASSAHPHKNASLMSAIS